MNDKIESIIGSHGSLLDKVFMNLHKAGFDDAEFKELDHIAYRTESPERYEAVKRSLTDFAADVSEVLIANRPIAVFELRDPLRYDKFTIKALEVLAPKENNRYKDGLEHAEFVTKTSLMEFKDKHSNTVFKLDAYAREINPELILEFDGCSAKFHAQSLLEVRRSA